MGSASAFLPARLVIGILYSPGIIDLPVSELEGRFGPCDLVGPDLDFPWSDYYDEEMAGRPRRGFLSFERPVDPAELAGIKIWTNELEQALSPGGRRRLNLDPGILELSHFLLATTKNRPHRIPLSRGIYAELTLVYERGDYRPLPWTYPDWASEEYRAILRGLRDRIKAGLRAR